MPGRGSPKSRYGPLAGDDLLDAGSSADLRVLFGLLGASPRQRRWRLFLSLNFDEYLEFARKDVVHSHRLSAAESQVGGTVVWLRREAEITHVRTVSREAQREFLGGDLSERFLTEAGRAPSSPLRSAVGAFVAGGCHTGGDFDTLCVACTAVPTALVGPVFRARQLGD